MFISLFLSSALAGELVIDVKLPARVSIDGEVVAEIYRESVVRMPVDDGVHKLVITTGGVPRGVDVTIGPNPAVVLVGRTGLSVTHADASPAAPMGDANVQFRTAHNERLLVQVGNQRVVIPPGAGVSIPLPVGDHPMTVRNTAGTSIYARGMLIVRGGADLVVQISEGMLPETSGEGLSFQPGGR